MMAPNPAQVEASSAAWADTETRGDVDAPGRILAEDFSGVGPRGFLLPCAAWLARHRSGDLRYETIVWDELTVRAYGATLLAIGRQDARGSYRGYDLGGQLRGTLIWVWQDEAWRLAGVQYSPLAG